MKNSGPSATRTAATRRGYRDFRGAAFFSPACFLLDAVAFFGAVAPPRSATRRLLLASERFLPAGGIFPIRAYPYD